MILVTVRCQRCWTALAQVTERPAEWSGDLEVGTCRRCRPRPGRLVKVLSKSGLRRWAIVVGIEWETLRPYIERAELTGRTQDAPLTVTHDIPRTDV